MAKNKNKQSHQQQLTPEKYIRQKGRNLPIVNCQIEEGWQDVELGPFTVIVTRQHVNGNFTSAAYLVDMGCRGVIASKYGFNLLQFEYDDFLDEIRKGADFDDISYNEAHNIIFGAVGYAEELGFEPDKSFNLTEYLLDEDTDDIPLIEYDFGKNGKPYLLADDRLEASRFLPILEKSTNGDFEYKIITEEDGFEDNEDDYDLSDYGDEDIPYGLSPSEYPETPYTYNHPEYPGTLNLIHSELNRFFTPPSQVRLTKKEVDSILALPRESLIADLKQVMLYSLGRAYAGRGAENFDNYTSIIHAIFFLGELRAAEALDVVFEFMRQGEQSWGYQISDLAPDLLGMTLYYVGREKLPELLDFAKEPGLYSYFKAIVFVAVNFVADEAGRRDEVLDWYRHILRFYGENADDINVYSARFGGLMMNELTDLNPKELQTEIKEFFDKCEVDEDACGYEEDILKYILKGGEPNRERLKMNIYERYDDYADYFGYE